MLQTWLDYAVMGANPNMTVPETGFWLLLIGYSLLSEFIFCFILLIDIFINFILVFDRKACLGDP